MDSLDQLADEQLWLLAEDVRIQLEKGTGTRPVLYLLAAQRQRAVQAIKGLINVDPTDVEQISGFQREAALFFDLMENCREMLQRGREADQRIAENERESMAKMLDDMSPEERKALNIEPKGED
jgi:hypothetical protein